MFQLDKATQPSNVVHAQICFLLACLCYISLVTIFIFLLTVEREPVEKAWTLSVYILSISSCVQVEEHHAVDIDVYHCPNCDVVHGPSLSE